MILEFVCPHCRFVKKVDENNIQSREGATTCPRCMQRFQFSIPVQATIDHAAEVIQTKIIPCEVAESQCETIRKGSPWENISSIGIWRGIAGTFKETLFSPGGLFKSLTFKGGQGEPFAFGLLAGSIGSMFGLYWHYLKVAVGDDIGDSSFFGNMSIGLFFLVLIVVVPAIVAAGIYIYSGILHLMLLILRAGKNGFEATFRVVAYSQTAKIWGVIPFIGTFVSIIWQLVVVGVGLREIHETSLARVIMAFIFPILMVSLLATMVLILIFFNFIGY
jgi:hypothetical protein